jgi:hypothetical protein
MTRQILSPEEIQKYVQIRVNYLREVQEDDAEVRIPLPVRRPVDGDGCNWNIDSFEGEKAYAPDVLGIVKEAQKKVNLPEE